MIGKNYGAMIGAMGASGATGASGDPRPAGTRQRRFFSSSLAARLVAVIVAQ
jgi:hypothetical protein